MFILNRICQNSEPKNLKPPYRINPCSVHPFWKPCYNSCYVGETVRHFPTRVKEHLARGRASHIFKHLQKDLSGVLFIRLLHVLDHVSTSFQLKIKETIHIQREQPSLHLQLRPRHTMRAGGGWRVAGGGWRMADGGWRMADSGWKNADDKMWIDLVIVLTRAAPAYFIELNS